MDPRLATAMADARMTDAREIPRDFLLGAATAAFQIEGAADEDGRGPSIWDTFCAVPGAVANGDNGDVACDHYHRFREDVGLMKDLGLDTYRFSVSWARVCPDGVTPNPKGLQFYSDLVDELLAAGIKPWLTLYHWDLPQALQDHGGWTNRDTAYHFANYALAVYKTLGNRVDFWTTLNEPWCSSFLSYTSGEHAPGHRSLEEGMLASHHLLLAHGLAVRALRDVAPDLNLGLTVNVTPAQALDPGSVEDRRAAALVDGQFNRWFLDPLFRGQYPQDIVEAYRALEPDSVQAFENAVMAGDLDIISTPIETLGINYYQGAVVTQSLTPSPELAGKIGFDSLELPPRSTPKTNYPTSSPMRASLGFVEPETYLPRTHQEWEIDPLFLKHILIRVDREYSGPAGTSLYMTENGMALDDVVVPGPNGPEVHDDTRSAYLELHLAATLDAREEGADVRGFFYWSLMDNFEWAWGYEERFGIIYVDFKTGQRTLKDSAKHYREIIATRQLNVCHDAGKLVRRGTIMENVALI